MTRRSVHPRSGPNRRGGHGFGMIAAATSVAVISASFGGRVLGVSTPGMSTVLALVVGALVLIATGNLTIPKEALPLVALVYLAATSATWTTAAKGASQQLLLLAAVLTSLLASYTIGATTHPQTVLRSVDQFATLCSIWFLGTWVLKEAGLLSVGVNRVAALAALAPLAVLAANWREGHRRSRVLALCMVIFVAATLSRTAAAIAGGVILVVIVLARLRGRSQRLGVAIAGMFAAFVAIKRIPAYQARFFGGDRALHAFGMRINTEGRMQFWTVTFEGSKDRILTGHGSGSARALIESKFPGLGHPHQDYLRLLYEFGLVGLTCWLLFILLMVRGLRRVLKTTSDPASRTLARAAIVQIVIVVISGLTDNSFVYAYCMIPMAVLGGVGLAQRHRSTSDSAPVEVARPSGASRPPLVRRSG